MKNTKYPNVVEFEVEGTYALFSDPIMRLGGEKTTMQVPTYEALKGVMSSIYWKPTFTWYIDQVRVMNEIKTETMGLRTLRYSGSSQISYYTYLKDCRYQVQAHFEWNENRPDLACDRDENKHHQIALRMIEKGGRRDVYLGTRECQADVKPCVFGEGEGFYDNGWKYALGLVYHGITYADESYSDDTRGRMTVNFWTPVMENGIIRFVRPEECPYHKAAREMGIKKFVPGVNFSCVKDLEVT